MAQPTHLLFPNLPPELRQEIYTYVSNDTSTTALTTGLPLGLKTFTCKHTTIQLLPVHHGSAGLLSLPHTLFPEAAEYRTWLLSNAIELRIGVHFHGRVNSFVQADWDKKVETHLDKLVKRHQWLRKVSRYDVKILWIAADGALKSKGGKRVAGSIPAAMVNSLTRMMDEGVRKRKGEVKVSLVLENLFASVHAVQAVKFGLDVFLHHGNEGAGLRRLAKEVRIGSCMRPVFSASLIREEEGAVEWSEGTLGQLVMGRTCLDGDADVAVVTRGKKDVGFPFGHMLRDCMGRN